MVLKYLQFHPYVSPNVSLGIISDISLLIPPGIPLENNQRILKVISLEKKNNLKVREGML